ncbi:MAG: Fic family protein [Kofleriaceae bacterium]
MAGTPLDVDRPVALAVDVATRGWLTRAEDPEMVCATAWSQACHTWWHDPTDDRLRRRVLDVLLLDGAELEGWVAMPLDEPGLVRAHGHVIAMRAGVERGAVNRILATGALRSGPVISHHRSGRMIQFPDPDEMRGYVRTLPQSVERLPLHPFMRAAWISDTLGSIHPFTDANGGTARFLSSLALVRAWLPPLVLSSKQRDSTYITAIVTHDHRALERVIYDAVQTELGTALLAGTGASATWDPASQARATTWIELADQAWCSAVGGQVMREASGAGGLARLARRGYRLARLRHRPVRDGCRGCLSLLSSSSRSFRWSAVRPAGSSQW